MGATASRVKVDVRWDKSESLWNVLVEAMVMKSVKLKKNAVKWAAQYCDDMRESEGTKSELYIYTKKQRIGKGRSGRRTYGEDPRSSKG